MFLLKKTVIIFGLLQICVNSNAQSDSDQGYTYTPGIGRHKVHNSAKTWDAARLICEQEGGDLAVINCRKESKVIAELFRKSLPNTTGSYDINYALIGFHDRWLKDVHITLKNNTIEAAGFNEWDPFEPSDKEDDENCGSVSHSGRLNDISCIYPYAFVCERPELEHGLPVKVNVTVNDEVIIEGNKINITCNVDGYPAPTVSWYKDGNRIEANDRISISETNSLVIFAAKISDSGNYTCEAKNKYTSHERTIDIKVVVPVKAKISVNEGPFHEGNAFSIICNVDGHPRPTIKWYKDDIPIKTSYRIKIFQPHILAIRNALKHDVGNYSCEAANDYSNSTDTVDIKIDVPVGVKISVDKNPFPEDGEFSISCEADGYPTPKVQWYKDGIPVHTNNRIKFSGNKLIISSADKNDAGQYRCEAANEYSNITDTVDIKMAAPFEGKITVDKGPFLAGSTFSMFCNVDMHQNPNLIWYKDDIPIQTNHRFKTFANMLIITDAEILDSGKYCCGTPDGNFSNADSVDVIVTVPVEVKITKDQGPFEISREFSLDCEVDGYPIPVVRWSKDDNPIQTNHKIKIFGNKLTISDVDENDAGRYRCKAANDYTSSSHSVDIEVTSKVKVHVTAQEDPFMVGTELNLACNVDGYPTPKVFWYKDDDLIHPNNRIKIFDSKRLIISDAIVSDTGKYRCEASNQFSSGSHTVDISVRDEFNLYINIGNYSADREPVCHVIEKWISVCTMQPDIIRIPS